MTPALYWLPFPACWQVEPQGLDGPGLQEWARKLAQDCEESARHMRGKGARAGRVMQRHRAERLRQLAGDAARCQAIAAAGRGNF